MNLRVEDYGLQTDRQLYGTPHGVTLAFFGAADELLASAHSIEPAGYVLAIHPDPTIGDCLQYENSQREYARCFALHSAWVSHWAPRVRTATANIGACVLEKLPVSVYSSNEEWWLWWVPLPHVGGVPRRYFELVVKVNTKSCAAVRQYSRFNWNDNYSDAALPSGHPLVAVGDAGPPAMRNPRPRRNCCLAHRPA